MINYSSLYLGKGFTQPTVVPLFKSGSHKDPSNHRGITINSALGMVFSISLPPLIPTKTPDGIFVNARHPD